MRFYQIFYPYWIFDLEPFLRNSSDETSYIRASLIVIHPQIQSNSPIVRHRLLLSLNWCSKHQLLLCSSTLGLTFRQALCSGLTFYLWLCTVVHALTKASLVSRISLCSFECGVYFFRSKRWVWRRGRCEDCCCCWGTSCLEEREAVHGFIVGAGR